MSEGLSSGLLRWLAPCKKFRNSLARIRRQSFVLEHLECVRIVQAESIDFNQCALVDLVGIPRVAQHIAAESGKLLVETGVREAEIGEVHGFGLPARIGSTGEHHFACFRGADSMRQAQT